jgi:drug/metabolite transporter (DMT)-like permease
VTSPRLRADAALVGAALLFGGTFIVVQEGVEQAEPVPFIGARYLIALLVLAPFARRRPPTPGLARDGVVAGIALGAGYIFQTAGLQYTTSSTSAFITYLLVVFVPLIAAVVLRRRPHGLTLVGVAVAVVGLALLTGGGSGRLGKGEILTLGCAVSFAAHIIVLAEVARRHDVVRLTLVQIATVCAGCGIAGLFLGGYGFGAKAWVAAAATGIGATALAFVLQVWAQRIVGPTRTALVLLLEPVFAAAFGYVVGERLGWIGVLGGLLILVSVAVTEVGPQLLTQRSRVGEPSR